MLVVPTATGVHAARFHAETMEAVSKELEVMRMSHTMFGGDATMKLSSWSFRLAGTLLMLMLPIFFVGRVLGLSQQPANVALGTLGIAAALTVIVGTVAVIWRK